MGVWVCGVYGSEWCGSEWCVRVYVWCAGVWGGVCAADLSKMKKLLECPGYNTYSKSSFFFRLLEAARVVGVTRSRHSSTFG